jgi:hypothetical protein
MVEIRTTRTDADVDAFLDSVDDDVRRRDALMVKELMEQATGEKPAMWGPSIVGFAPYVYRPKSGGAEREWFKVGFSPRKQALTLYVTEGFNDYQELLADLGPHTTGKSCLYIKDLDEVDNEVLTELISQSLAHFDPDG